MIRATCCRIRCRTDCGRDAVDTPLHPAKCFLSFLGRVQEPSASGATWLQEARSIRALTSFPWLLFVPGTAIFITVMAFNFLGDGLRDALDPRRVSGGRA